MASAFDDSTVQVRWIPGFNGGAKQHFFLEYVKQWSDGWRSMSLDPTLPDVARQITINVSDLRPETGYTFRVKAENLFGESEYSKNATAQTLGLFACNNIKSFLVMHNLTARNDRLWFFSHCTVYIISVFVLSDYSLYSVLYSDFTWNKIHFICQ